MYTDEIDSMLKDSKLLISNDEIESSLDVLSIKISSVLHDKNPVLLCVMLGSMVFSGNLIKRLDFPLEVDYIHVTRYIGNINGRNEILWKAEPSIDISNRSVLILDDIFDEGITLSCIKEYCIEKNVSEFYSAVLLKKEKERKKNIKVIDVDFFANKIANEFVFGYGLDYKEYLRNLNNIYSYTGDTQSQT